jgi:hypothetical protein
MTVTHGTRSTYNKGCRCDACREASRLTRARQRSAASDRTAAVEFGVKKARPWVFVVLLAAAGAGSLLHARSLKAANMGQRSRYGRRSPRVLSLSDSRQA